MKLNSLLCSLIVLSGISHSEAGTIFKEDFTGNVPKPTWAHYSGNWSIEAYKGVACLAPDPKTGERWLPNLDMSFKTNTPTEPVLPLEVQYDAVVFSNNKDANRFSVGFYSDGNHAGSVYQGMVRPGGTAQIYKLGAHEPEILATGTDPVIFPEGVPVHIRFVWGADSRLALFIEGQLVVKTEKAVEPTPAPFSVSFWQIFHQHDPKNRVLFQNIDVRTNE